MDRVNIAFAMHGGMDKDLGITATMAGLAGGIFFLGYLFLQVPGGKIAVHGSGKNSSAGHWSPGRSSLCLPVLSPTNINC